MNHAHFSVRDAEEPIIPLAKLRVFTHRCISCVEMAEGETVTTPEHGIKVISIERTLIPLIKQASIIRKKCKI